MATKPAAIIVMLIFCVFMGVTAISLGVGAVFPSINMISRPLVCPNGSLEPERQVFRPYPGKTVTTVTWYCTDQDGAKTQLSSFPLTLFAGSIYGLGLFLILFISIRLFRPRKVSAL